MLVTGTYGAGRTAAFTGFTPPASNATSLPIDQYLIGEPQARSYFVLFANILAEVMPGEQELTANLLSIHEKPLFQTLKEEPEAELAVTNLDLPGAAGSPVHRRIRIASQGGYGHLVHMRVEWAEAGPKPYLTELSDNDFELLPNESREIEQSWRASSSQQKPVGTLIVTAANAPEVRQAF